ncbi:MAG: DNA polymerase IV [Actinobacteria bacterium]|nr:DNA polymerase IV [Actinomycetota bacterium]
MEMPERRILHVDMDAFFAQIEQRDNPKLRSKPVIVGGPLNRGVVSSVSYEGRPFGVHSGMPLYKARRLCPFAILLPVDMEKYLHASRMIRNIFCRFTPLVEMVSCDEAYLDVTGCERLFGQTVDMARRIKAEIMAELNLTASVGVSYNKFFAKLASDMEKPDGLVVILDNFNDKIREMPISALHGVGKASEAKLLHMGIKTVGELAATPLSLIESALGKSGRQLHKMANGVDERPVVPFSDPKSIGREVTFGEDLQADDEAVIDELRFLSERVARNLRMEGFKALTITIKIRYSDFKTISHAETLKRPTNVGKDIFTVALLLLSESVTREQMLRLIGVSASNLIPFDGLENISIFGDDEKADRLEEALDRLNARFGDKVKRGKVIIRSEYFSH